MEIIPAIDLLGGQCVRLHQGDYDQVTRFSDDPVAQALEWQRQGASRLHLVDLDGARSGEPTNDQVVKAITTALSIPVQLGGGVRTAERAEDLLAFGLDRVILGTVAVEQPELVRQLASRHPGRILVGIDAKQGRVATRGWIDESPLEATALATSFEGSGVAAIISTDIATDGTLAGPNLEALRAMAEASSVPVIASGGIGTLEELYEMWSWQQLGYHDKPVGILNSLGYYDSLMAFIGQVVDHGFMADWQTELVTLGTEPEALLQSLVQKAGFAPRAKVELI
jgi:phosphoribosylformimino-5-aminoimidazole carboxamide ribotide isomerase